MDYCLKNMETNLLYNFLILFVNIFVAAYIVSVNSNIKTLKIDLKEYSNKLCLLQGEHNSLKDLHLKK